MESGNGSAVTKADLKAALTEVKDKLMERMCQIETNLLTEFHRYGKASKSGCTPSKAAKHL
jgi:hypothetical protein